MMANRFELNHLVQHCERRPLWLVSHEDSPVIGPSTSSAASHAQTLAAATSPAFSASQPCNSLHILKKNSSTLAPLNTNA
jgi:hypothetical protein